MLCLMSLINSTPQTCPYVSFETMVTIKSIDHGDFIVTLDNLRKDFLL